MSLDSWLESHRRRRVEAGLRRTLRPRPADEGSVDLAGNDYLGLSTHRRVVAAARDAAETWGVGAGASRLVTGTTELHSELESSLADFTGRAAALVFSSGYLANLAAVTALCDADTLIVSDAHVHASLVDACRLAHRSRLEVVPHNDLVAVDAALRSRDEPRALVLCESVYSVLGDSAPVAQLVETTREHDAILLVDEAHGFGVAGVEGRGLVADVMAGSGLGVPDLAHVVVTLTLSKSLGSQGGAVLATAAVIDELVNTARTFIYDTGLAPPAAAGALAALDVVRAEPARCTRVLEVSRRLSQVLGVPTPAGAVLSVAMPGPLEALSAQAQLLEHGFVVGCFRPPSVPDGVSRLRLTAKADLSDEAVERLITVLPPMLAAR